MNNIAIITARGGSKRIPRKNIKEFCGKPIICYSIEAALESGVFDTVMVSTDDEEIAQIAKEAGAEVPFFRSEATSNDYAGTADVLKEVIDTYAGMGQTFDYGCCIYPTAPFVTGQKLRVAMDKLINRTTEQPAGPSATEKAEQSEINNAEQIEVTHQTIDQSTAQTEHATTVMPVVAYSFPPQRSVRIGQGGYLEKLDPVKYEMRSQDLEPIYHDAGQFYGFDIKAFSATGQLIGDKVLPIVVNELEVQDIDNYEDWAMAEMKYRLMEKHCD